VSAEALVLLTSASRAASPRREDWEIGRDEVEIGSELVRGTFGLVYAGTYRGSPVAVKFAHGSLAAAKRQEVADLAARMKRLPEHENVVTFFGAAVDDGGLLIVMELCEGGDLLSFLQKQPLLEPALRLAFVVQVARGMAHLHDAGVVHRDLAARHVLLGGAPDGVPLAKVAGFGLSRTITFAGTSAQVAEAAAAAATLAIRWSAPEVLAAQQYSRASDVWAFGVTVWEIYSAGSEPYEDIEDNDNVIDFVVDRREQLFRPVDCPVDVWRLVEQCFAYASDQRPSFHHLAGALAKVSESIYS